MTKTSIRRTTQFKKNYKKLLKSGKDTQKLRKIITLLVSGAILPEKYKDHALTGNYRGERELHVEPDWLLIYHFEDEQLVLVLTDTGSHPSLF
jgi:mRNA interferase YafQ